MTIGKIIQRVQSLYSKGVQSDDSRLTSRHIYDKLVSVRSRLLGQKINKRQKISTWSYQVLECIELIKAPISECPCLPNEACTILRTKFKLPRPVSSLDSHVINSVTSIDGSTKFDETSWNINTYSSGNKYTSVKPSWYIKNDYMYITDAKNIRGITIVGLFDNPIDVLKVPSMCCDETDLDVCECYLDIEFPVETDLIDPIVELTSLELIEVFSKNQEDQSNDSRDNLIQQSK